MRSAMLQARYAVAIMTDKWADKYLLFGGSRNKNTTEDVEINEKAEL
jgi:hypothetical protein